MAGSINRPCAEPVLGRSQVPELLAGCRFESDSKKEKDKIP
jgi:hypothetical protein